MQLWEVELTVCQFIINYKASNCSMNNIIFVQPQLTGNYVVTYSKELIMTIECR